MGDSAAAGRSHARPERLYDLYAFDLDGTIYLGDDLLPGARSLIEGLREREIPLRFLSNNPTKGPEQYAEKLTGLGLPTSVSEIVSSIETTVRWLTGHAADAVVFVIGEEPLSLAIADAGFEMSDDPAEIDVVVASYDRGFDYRKLQIAFDAIWYEGRARLIATNPDRFCPFPGGRGEPDCAAITAAIEACTGRRAEAVLGKPSPAMLHAALDGLEIALEDCMMVGDRLATDIRMGLDAGMATALVLTGDSSAADLERLAPEDRPSFVLERVGEVLPS